MNRSIFLLILLIFCGCEESGDTPVILFVNDVNPELHRTMNKIAHEIERTDQKIILLSDLKDMYPNQRQAINKSLDQWRPLLKDLTFTFNNISNKVEDAYVAYRIDEIQGRNQFNLISKALLIDANAVLAEAELIKSTLERELYEK